MNYYSDRLRTIIALCCALVLISLIWAIAWGSVNALRLDHSRRLKAIAACQVLQDGFGLTECLRAAK